MADVFVVHCGGRPLDMHDRGARLVVVIEVSFVAQARDAEGLVLVPLGQVEESGRRGGVSCKRVKGSFAQLIGVGGFGDLVVFEKLFVVLWRIQYLQRWSLDSQVSALLSQPQAFL